MNYSRQFSKMFTAHLKMTLREKQAWFWGIFFPIILMVIFMLIFAGGSDEQFKVKIAVVHAQPNESSEMLYEQIKQLPVFEIESGQPVSRDQADQWVKDKEVDAAIVLPDTAGINTVQLIVNKENEQGAASQASAGILERFIQQANLIAAGVTPTYELQFSSISSGSADLQYSDFLLTGMIALSIAQGGLFGMVDMVEMRRKGLLKRLRMTPANMGLYGLSDMAMRMIFGLVQLIVLSLIGVFGFGATLHIDWISLIIIFFIGSLSFNAMGYLFSSFSKTTEAYMGMANIASFVMMFLSGIFFPIETMPEWLQPVSQILPLTYFADGLRDGLVYATGVVKAEFWLGIGVLVLWGAVTYGLGALLYKSKSIAATR